MNNVYNDGQMTKEVPRTSVLRDEELNKTLIARLRKGWHTGIEAADRIELLEYMNNTLAGAVEQLVATNEALSISNATLIAERDAAEAKLAENEVRLRKAVEALEYYAVEAMPWDADDSLIARTALAEIKSGIATTPYGLEGESHE